MADGDSTNTSKTNTGEALSEEAQEVLGAVLILERDYVHQERPRVRGELIKLIKNHVR